MPIEAITKPKEEKAKVDRINLVLVEDNDNDIKTRNIRKLITGDPDKNILDHCNEKPQILFLDKVAFTFGIACICFSEWLALRFPEMFPKYYYSLFTILMLHRFFSFVQLKKEMFMMDCCYFVNLSVIFQTWLFPHNLIWFKIK